MLKHKKTVLTVLLLTALLGLVLLALFFVMKGKAPANQESSAVVEGFSCFIYDENNKQVDAFWSDKDKVWYMFVPSTVSIPDMSLSYTGAVTAVSVGTLHEEEAVVAKAFSKSGDRITLKDVDGVEYVVQVMQSDLPSMHIVLNGTILDTVHQDKNVKYKGNSVYIMDPDGAYDLTVEDSVEMKGRGNTTWVLFDKKGYQIKFDDKTSVLGMGEAKKWILLANAGDDSMMRTMLTYRMAEKLDMAFVPDFAFVDLWIDGDYRGTYMIGEKVEPGSSRLDLQDDQGAIFEHDEAFYAEEDYWVLSEQLQRHFAMKEIVEEDDPVIEAAMADFQTSVDEFVEYLRSAVPSEVTLEELSTMIDVDSFIKYYLVTEYVLNREAIVTSFYWYKDGSEDVIHLGPVWDYDTCIGNDGSAYTENSAGNHPLFPYLHAIPAYFERAQELKELYWPYLTAMADDADVIKAMIEDSAAMNYLRWDLLGKPSNKNGSYFADTFDEAVANVKSWLKGRETAFKIEIFKMINSSVSDRYDTMEIFFDDGSAYENVTFAVWHDTEKQTDLRWYNANRDENGILRASANLIAHNGTGIYHIDAYAGEQKVASGQSYVAQFYTPNAEISSTISEDNAAMDITFAFIEPEEHEKIQFAVWSDVDGQDDLRWYEPKQNTDGQWEYTVDLRLHNSTGIYNIHAYSIDNGVYTKMIEYLANVENAPN